MAKYRKKPVVVEAVQWTGARFYLIRRFCPTATGLKDSRKITEILIPTLEGTMRAEIGDWIIRGIKGEFYPCKPDIFEATYEPVESEAQDGRD